MNRETTQIANLEESLTRRDFYIHGVTSRYSMVSSACLGSIVLIVGKKRTKVRFSKQKQVLIEESVVCNSNSRNAELALLIQDEQHEYRRQYN